MGFSIGKLLVIAVVLYVVWYVTKHPGLVESVTRAVRLDITGKRRPRAAAGPALAAEELKKCDRCGAFVAAQSGACGRADCPRGRA